MAKNFSSKEAKDLIATHKSLSDALRDTIALEISLKLNIKNSADSIAMQEILTVMRDIPIEELGRHKKGLRIKPLTEHHYTSIADIYALSIYNLAAIRGVSQDNAYTIKRIVNDIADKIRKETKIKLSADNKNKDSTKLVKDISIYKNSLPFIREAHSLEEKYGDKIESLLRDLKSSTNILKWLFTSKVNKDKAVVAYNALKELLASEYNNQIQKIVSNIRKISSINDIAAWDDFVQNNVRFYNILEETNPGLLGTDDAIYGLPEELARKIQDECFFPDGLKCTLRRYQEWGVKYILHQEKVLLGDEMGLGKTIQAIATMVSLKNTGATHFVVVCPASVVINWCREITKHSLLSVTKVHGSDKAAALRAWKKTGGVAVTTYETTSCFKLEEDFMFSLLVVDEAHYIKNPQAKRTLNTKALCAHASRLLFMTGTALENRVDEMITLIDMLQPKIANQISHIAFMSAAPKFRLKVAPVYYRRKRDEVLTELPELIESKEWCSMTREEEIVYEEAVLSKHFPEARRVSWNIDNLENSSKANRLREIVEEAEMEDRKVIVFSFFLDTINKVTQFLGRRCLNPISGAVTAKRRQEIIDEFNNAPAGSVLVSQIQSGGTGLNIQSASVVVICETQFKPSIENQAISRAYRMGQARNVLVYRLLCENSIDERITEILEQKQKIFNAFADKSVSAQQSLEIDEKSFGDIITEEINRINNKRGTSPIKVQNTNNADYYDNLLTKSYTQIIESLWNKYGRVPGDYFVNETCRSKNRKILRTKEGLFCHHIDEDKAILLSKSMYAVNNPFEYQKANRLVYCNFLEHLLLHIKIVEEPKNANANRTENQGIGGAVQYIIRQINGFYGGQIPTEEYLAIAMNVIENDYLSYLKMLRYLWDIIKANPLYSSFITKEQLAMNWDGVLIQKIYDALNS